jgi:hypothetical protein
MAMPLKMKEHKELEPIRAFVSISKQEAQVLMDDLWDCGLRPSEGSGSAGALLATQNHLSDMKKIVFKTLKNKGVTL